MSAFRLTSAAARDLDRIARWTLQTWGESKMETYLRSLDDRFRWLALNPQSGRDRADIGSGYRSWPQGQHVIFYIVQPDWIAIIGVPHQAMDVDSYFT